MAFSPVLFFLARAVNNQDKDAPQGWMSTSFGEWREGEGVSLSA